MAILSLLKIHVIAQNSRSFEFHTLNTPFGLQNLIVKGVIILWSWSENVLRVDREKGTHCLNFLNLSFEVFIFRLILCILSTRSYTYSKELFRESYGRRRQRRMGRTGRWLARHDGGMKGKPRLRQLADSTPARNNTLFDCSISFLFRTTSSFEIIPRSWNSILLGTSS